MSDEPLFCPWCGLEIGGGCICEHDSYETPLPHRDKRYCEFCGIIPAPGKECKFYPGSMTTDYKGLCTK